MRIALHATGTITGPIATAVGVLGADHYNQIDKFNISQLSDIGTGYFETRTYTVPGEKLEPDFAASAVGTDALVQVLVFGRAN